MHPDKTRLIEFGRYAVANRKERREGKPETFQLAIAVESPREPRPARRITCCCPRAWCIRNKTIHNASCTKIVPQMRAVRLANVRPSSSAICGQERLCARRRASRRVHDYSLTGSFGAAASLIGNELIGNG
jgi:hypothetical protein